MPSIRRQGLPLLCVFGGAWAPLGTKNVVAHGRSGRMRVLDVSLAQDDCCCTWVYNLSEPAGRPRRKAEGRFAATPEPPADPAGFCGVATMPPLGIRCEAAHKRPHAVPLAFDAYSMVCRPRPAACGVRASGPCRVCRSAGNRDVLLLSTAGGARRRTTHPGPDARGSGLP